MFMLTLRQMPNNWSFDAYVFCFVSVYVCNIILPCMPCSVRAHVAAIAEHWRGTGRYVVVALLFFNMSGVAFIIQAFRYYTSNEWVRWMTRTSEWWGSIQGLQGSIDAYFHNGLKTVMRLLVPVTVFGKKVLSFSLHNDAGWWHGMMTTCSGMTMMGYGPMVLSYFHIIAFFFY